MESVPLEAEMDSPEPTGLPTETRLKDLRVGSAPVAITARLVTAQRREIARKSDGGRRTILSGLLTDGTATVRFTWWDPPAEEIDPGTVLRAVPVEIREYRGRAELSFGWRTRVAPASEHELPVVPPEELPLRSLRELRAGSDGFRLEVRVAEVAPKMVTVGTERREIHEGLLHDRSGLAAFTSWTDFRLRPGEALRITGAYVREFRARPQLVLDQRASVERIAGTELPAAEERPGTTVEPMGAILGPGGRERVTLEGRAVGVQPPSGLIFRCPSCPKSLRGGVCPTHGAVEGRPDLRLRLILDDGTGAVTVNLERAQVERLTGETLAGALQFAREHPDPAAVGYELSDRLFGRRFRARGPLRIDDFGASMYPTEIGPAEPGPDRAALDLRWRRSP